MLRLFSVTLLVAALVAAPEPAALSAKRKIDLIRAERVPRGSQTVIRQDELNAWVRIQVKQVVTQGLRDPRLELGTNRATGYALVDFPKLRQGMGRPMNWLIAKLIAGERPVQVDAHIRSGGGRATVTVDRVQISGMSISGGALDYLIRNFLWSYYPDAAIDRPFALAHHIDRLDVYPGEVRVVIAK